MAEIPEASRLAAVAGYASDAVGCSPDSIRAVSRLEDGNRHSVYKVSYVGEGGPQRDVVIRVSYGGDPDDCAQAAREAKVLKKVGGLAAPVLYDFRCSGPWFKTPAMCMQFVSGHERELSSVGGAEIERLGLTVATVHEQPIEDLVEEMPAADTVGSYARERLESVISTLVWARDPLPAAMQTRFKAIADSLARSLDRLRHATSFRTLGTLALLHGDIGPGNILWIPDPVLIDWEYTRLGDPADEIAYLFDQNGLTTPQRDAFWLGYREGSSQQSRLNHVADRVQWWEPVTLLGSALWWAERFVRRNEADTTGKVDPEVPRRQAYYLEHVVRRLNRLEKLLAH